MTRVSGLERLVGVPQEYGRNVARLDELQANLGPFPLENELPSALSVLLIVPASPTRLLPSPAGVPFFPALGTENRLPMDDTF
ncbi:hypothetical protein VTK73DRAFT_7422 [Phialemonium thermophilum]|uniref:Uncharacterized protein n=1 Tax=Phialemonium thermophilum TaxID=223376 RepID=A0ABR3WEQ7_9PEZI